MKQRNAYNIWQMSIFPTYVAENAQHEPVVFDICSFFFALRESRAITLTLNEHIV